MKCVAVGMLDDMKRGEADMLDGKCDVVLVHKLDVVGKPDGMQCDVAGTALGMKRPVLELDNNLQQVRALEPGNNSQQVQALGPGSNSQQVQALGPGNNLQQVLELDSKQVSAHKCDEVLVHTRVAALDSKLAVGADDKYVSVVHTRALDGSNLKLNGNRCRTND